MLKELAEVDGVQLAIDGEPFLPPPAQVRTSVQVYFRSVPTSIRKYGDQLRVAVRRFPYPQHDEYLDVDSVVTALGFHASGDADPFGGLESTRLFRVGPGDGAVGQSRREQKQAAGVAKSLVEATRRSTTRSRRSEPPSST